LSGGGRRAPEDVARVTTTASPPWIPRVVPSPLLEPLKLPGGDGFVRSLFVSIITLC
jgi:hypothetical protein